MMPSSDRMLRAAGAEDDIADQSLCSSHGAPSSSVASGSEHRNGNGNVPVTIAKEETSALRSMRWVVLAVLVCLTAGLAVGAYLYTLSRENKQFENEFGDFADKILEGAGDTLKDTFGAADLLSTSIVSSARHSSSTCDAAAEAESAWPSVYIPDFGLRAAKTIALSVIKIVALCMVVEGTEQREEWETFAAARGREWVDENINLLESDVNYFGPIVKEYFTIDNVFGESGDDLLPDNPDLTFPTSQTYPVIPTFPPYNFNCLALGYTKAHATMIETGKVTLTEPYMNPDPNDPDDLAAAEQLANFYKDRIEPGEEPMEPAFEIFFPVFDVVDQVKFDASQYKPVAGLTASFYWRDLFRNILPSGSESIIIVTNNECGSPFTYQLTGPAVKYLGFGDKHDDDFTDMGVSITLPDLLQTRPGHSIYGGPDINYDYCPTSFSIYPSDSHRQSFKTNARIINTIVAVFIGVFTSMVFLFYDRLVERRQKVVLDKAERSTAVVSSLFPENVHERLYAQNQAGGKSPSRHSDILDAFKSEYATNTSDAPIAELYKETTVLFADIVGFTSWSSSREPTEVFRLLECIYGSFDKIARRRGVFKVETIGDSYVAVCGLPKPQKNHAVIMARFAFDCRDEMMRLMHELVSSLGPSTADLKMRFGMNSGPTTAGVLRGERSRFQLFGDTVNTAARMESNGRPNMIQATQATADDLIAAGKMSWITARDELVEAKGKGSIQTFWLEHPEGSSGATATNHSQKEPSVSESKFDLSESKFDLGRASGKSTRSDAKLQRLVAWNVDLLEGLLRDIVKCNEAAGNAKVSSSLPQQGQQQHQGHRTLCDFAKGERPRDEVALVIPIQDDEMMQVISSVTDRNRNSVEVSAVVLKQLRTFVSSIANLYNDNPFHNFEHASHVAMSTKKLLARITRPNKTLDSASATTSDNRAFSLSSDPVVHFALVFSALIHDADHPGVTNTTLTTENNETALLYGNKSVAEQNSIAIGWSHFMSSQYKELRQCMFANDKQLQRFRQLVINCVIATDIFDKELKTSREQRWDQVFNNNQSTSSTEASTSSSSNNGSATDRMDEESFDDLRSTVILEHLIQAADVSHTMQHWAVYQKWNRKLFQEMRDAYKQGRNSFAGDPAVTWFQGECWFFDTYVLPLARKMQRCGAFGASYDEALEYAQANRTQWERSGKEIVETWLSEDEESVY